MENNLNISEQNENIIIKNDPQAMNTNIVTPPVLSPMVVKKITIFSKYKKAIFIALFIIVILISLVAGYFYFKNTADNSAKKYTDDVKVYIQKVHDTVSSNTGSPENIWPIISKLDMPHLNAVFWGNISTEYINAGYLQENTSQLMSKLEPLVSGSVALNSYSKSYSSGYEKALAAYKKYGDGAKEATDAYIELLSDVSDTLDANKDLVPQYFKVNFEDASKAYEQMANLYPLIIQAYKDNNKTKTEELYASYEEFDIIRSNALRALDLSISTSNDMQRAGTDIQAFLDRI